MDPAVTFASCSAFGDTVATPPCRFRINTNPRILAWTFSSDGQFTIGRYPEWYPAKDYDCHSAGNQPVSGFAEHDYATAEETFTSARPFHIVCKGFEVVGTVDDGRDAVAEVRRLNPDVLVIDISMPVLDGLEAASQLRSKSCRTKIVFLTVHQDQDYVDDAFAAGSSGYVAKSQVTSYLVPPPRGARWSHVHL